MSQRLEDSDGNTIALRVGTEIRVEGLQKAFGKNKVLRGIDLKIAGGEVVAIVGVSGSGKTVLLNMMLGLLDPDGGRILIADHDQPGTPSVDITRLGGRDLDGIHVHWGVVFQRNALFSSSVFENIALWLREVKNLETADIRLIARSVLESVELPTDSYFLDSPVGGLSGGMAKRLAIARALAMDPIVIVYDEPTSGLDPTSASHIQNLIHTAHFAHTPKQPKRTSVIVTHDKDLLSRLQPRVVMVHDGGIAFDGTFPEFQASDSPIIRPYFELMPMHNLCAMSAAPRRGLSS